MEFYLTPNATSFYSTPIEQTIWIVDDRIQTGMLRFLFNFTALGRFYNPFDQLDLPIFFVTEDDLGKNMNISDLHMVTKRFESEDAKIVTIKRRQWHESDENIKDIEPATRFQNFNSEAALNLPERIYIPDTQQFGYKSNHISNFFEQMSNPASLDNPNLNIEFNNTEILGSTDWLGIYCNFRSKFRCIFVRIEKIMDEPLLNNSIGVASVILHEIGHVVMDSPKYSSLEFSSPTSPKVAEALRYVLEEALANLIAYRCIRTKGLDKKSPYIERIAKFMDSQQPFPYSLGVKLGDATSSIPGRPIDQEIKSYILNWFKAKMGSPYLIKDVSGWVKLILGKSHYTSNDLKAQYNMLF